MEQCQFGCLLRFFMSPPSHPDKPPEDGMKPPDKPAEPPEAPPKPPNNPFKPPEVTP